jgi:F0F1-type ATP synthase membrane subunit b/b'
MYDGNGHYRRLIIAPALIERFRAALAEERAIAEQQHFEFLAEVAELQAELVELREVMQLIVGTLRVSAEQDVAELRHRLETALARLERKPNTPLH